LGRPASADTDASGGDDGASLEHAVALQQSAKSAHPTVRKVEREGPMRSERTAQAPADESASHPTLRTHARAQEWAASC
jgi:hypothetical protein